MHSRASPRHQPSLSDASSSALHNKRLRTAQRNLSSISRPGEQRPSAPAPAVKIRRDALGGGQHCNSCPLRLVPSVESAAQSSAAGLLVRNASCNTTFLRNGAYGWYKVAFASTTLHGTWIGAAGLLLDYSIPTLKTRCRKMFRQLDPADKTYFAMVCFLVPTRAIHEWVFGEAI